MTSEAWERLPQGPLRRTLHLAVSGDTHQYFDIAAGGVLHVRMPSGSPESGEKLVGIGMLDLTDDGADFDLWCPIGIARHEVSNLQAFQRNLSGEAAADID